MNNVAIGKNREPVDKGLSSNLCKGLPWLIFLGTDT